MIVEGITTYSKEVTMTEREVVKILADYLQNEHMMFADDGELTMKDGFFILKYVTNEESTIKEEVEVKI